MRNRIRQAGRQVGRWAARKVAGYVKAQWRALPGPTWLKVIIIGVAIAEVGPFFEIGILTYTNVRSALTARKARRAA